MPSGGHRFQSGEVDGLLSVCRWLKHAAVCLIVQTSNDGKEELSAHIQ